MPTRYLRESERASTPYLDRQYPPPMRDSLPRILATFTSRPRPFLSSGRNWRVTSITPTRFTSKTFVKSSNCIHSGGPMGMDLPALFTRPHRPAEGRRKGSCQLMPPSVRTWNLPDWKMKDSHVNPVFFVSLLLFVTTVSWITVQKDFVLLKLQNNCSLTHWLKSTVKMCSQSYWFLNLQNALNKSRITMVLYRLYLGQHIFCTLSMIFLRSYSLFVPTHLRRQKTKKCSKPCESLHRGQGVVILFFFFIKV